MATRAWFGKDHTQALGFVCSDTRRPYLKVIAEKTDHALHILDRWCAQVMRTRLEPMKKVARMLRRNRLLLLNWFRARGEISAGAVEDWLSVLSMH